MERQDDELWWWTGAGGRGNGTLAAALDRVVDVDDSRPDKHRLRLQAEVDPAELRTLAARLADERAARLVGPAGEVDVGVAEPGGDVWGATSRLRRRPGTVFYLDRRV